MKLLLDANLSHRLVNLLAGTFAELIHVREVGMAKADDIDIWTYARDQALTVVTQDADFRELQLAKGAPPKVVWLRLGNQSTAAVAATLRAHRDSIVSFVADAEQECLEVAEAGPSST